EKIGIATKGLRKTPGGVVSTQASELAKLQKEHPIVELILQYRELFKLKTTYVDALPVLVDPENKRLHTRFVQTGTATGRLSSAEPNLQNIPVRSEMADKIRKSFVAEEGFKLVSFDYSQIELRLAAALSQDEQMMKAFKEGLDIHALTAAQINKVKIKDVTSNMRRRAKVLNFGVLFGMGPVSFAQAVGVSKEQAKQFIEEYFKDFSGIARYIEEIKDEARRVGFVRTITGRRRWLPEIHSQNHMVRSQAERMAVNMPIQGSDADISKMSMIAIDKEFGGQTDVRLLLQIHDALLFEIIQEKIKMIIPKIKNLMENIVKLPVPLKVDAKVGDNWAELKPYA
ncbi:MAG: DNA polymerase, partial [Nitrospinota bacterium]